MIACEEFGYAYGEKIERYTLVNRNGVMIKICTLGGAITELWVPDRSGSLGDVVLGYENAESYARYTSNQGALIGRYGNRIGRGRFSLNGKEYQLALNDHGINHLHGGNRGFNQRIWKKTAQKDGEGPMIQLKYHSPDGEENYPGNLDVTVTYTLTADNAFSIEYEAVTDADCPVNLTNHTYFNLTGCPEKTILDHKVRIMANSFTPVDEGLIPTGAICPVDGTPFDFRVPKSIGQDLDSLDDQMVKGGGYDHNFILGEPNDYKVAAVVDEPITGREMTVCTDQPCIQFYIGNFLDGTEIGKQGKPLCKRHGFCLETQHAPDSPNQSAFPSVILHPGEIYHTKTVYQFSTIA